MSPEELLSRLVAIPSVNPPGGETEVARALQDFLASRGVPSEVLEPAPGRGSLIAQIGHGRRSLLLLSHTDVVPPGEGWRFDPFGGRVEAGRVWGRGALDCKALVVAEAFALAELARVRLDGRLIFAATADEERGGRMGVQWLLEHCPERLRADFALNEGGEEPLPGHPPLWLVQVGEKGVAWCRVEARGRSAHGSLPQLGDNAILRMSQVLERLRAYRPAVRLLPEVRDLLEEICRQRGWPPPAEENLDELLRRIEPRPLAALLHALTRTTASPNVIRGGTKVNVVPDRCELELDVRLLPGEEGQLERLREQLGVPLEVVSLSPPSRSPLGPFWRLIVEVVQEVVPGPPKVLPFISSGATDSRFLRRAGIPAYGISPLVFPDFDPELPAAIHGPNEAMDVRALHGCVELIIRLAERYLGGQAAAAAPAAPAAGPAGGPPPRS